MSKIFNADFAQRVAKGREHAMVVTKDLPYDQKAIDVKATLIKHGMEILDYNAWPEPIPLKNKLKGITPKTMHICILGIVDQAAVDKICKEEWVDHIYGHGAQTGRTSAAFF